MSFLPTGILIRSANLIELTFSSNPVNTIGASNFNIASSYSGNPDLVVIDVSIDDNVILLMTRPMFRDNLYLITLLDTETQPFVDTFNDNLSHDDNSRNIYFVGVEDTNSVRDDMLSKAPSIYKTDQDTVIRSIINTFAVEAQKANIALNETFSNNFINVPVVDELHYRGTSPGDRMNNEGAYLVSRVSQNPTGSTFAITQTYDPIADVNIPYEIINLRATLFSETLTSNSNTATFDGFILTCSKANIVKMNTAHLNTYRAVDGYTYDPTLLSYALLNNNFDRYARQYLGMTSNQVRLSTLSQDVFPIPASGDTIDITYQYDHTGKIIDPASIILYSIFKQVNEQINVGVSIFNLKFPNITNVAGNVLMTGGVQFYNSPNDFTKHPAFIQEITYKASALPNQVGQYAINYMTGEVYVYGTLLQIGSGSNPPVATYYYKQIGVQNTDYYINDDGSELTLNPLSIFAINVFNVFFNYEIVFVSGIDYAVSSHIEVLNERVENRYVSDFTIQAKNNQLKEVYQVKNETTGELYNAGFVEGNQIIFTGVIPPKTTLTNNELVYFAATNGEVMNVISSSTTLSPFGLKIYEIALKNKPIMSSRSLGIGAHFDSSLVFSTNNIFLSEYYFNNSETLFENINKLRIIGDYVVDYANSLIYVAVSNVQPFDVGSAIYSYGSTDTAFENILSVNTFKRGQNPTKVIKDFDTIFDVNNITPLNLDYCYEQFDGSTIVDNTNSIFSCQLQDNFTFYTKYPIQNIFNVFTQADVDAYNSATLPTRNLFNSKINSFNNNFVDLKTYVICSVVDGGTYFSVIIPELTDAVKSIIALSSGKQLLDSPLYIVKQNNIIMESIVASAGTAVITLATPATLIQPVNDFLVDVNNRRFAIQSLTGNQLTVSYGSTPPALNIGSIIQDQFNTIIAQFLNIINISPLGNNQSLLTYDFLPDGILAGYVVLDAAGNLFIIDSAVGTQIVVNNGIALPVIDAAAIIETNSLLIAGVSTTELRLPLDAPINVGDNLQIGYAPIILETILEQANNTGSAGGAGLLINYTSGQYFVDYSHLDDELIISYEYGDNQLDWSISGTLAAGDPYFVSYNFGANRNALQINFGSLANVDFLQVAPLNLQRETYRTALKAILAAFVSGPTREAITIIAKAFSQVDPLITEDVVSLWVLNRDTLSLQAPKITGNLIFANGKYNDGVLLQGSNSIKLPAASNLRILEGTFTTWASPNWNGDQADAELLINLPTATKEVYYNAGDFLPQNVPDNNWALNYASIGTAYVNNYLHTYNAKLLPTKTVGTYSWYRNEEILSAINDLDITLIGSVPTLNYVDNTRSLIDCLSVKIDDGYGIYSTGFYLSRQKTYYETLIINQVHLAVNPPYPQLDPSDPPSTPGTSDMVGEIHLQDQLGTRPAGTTDIRTNGWERQLYAELFFSPAIPIFYIDVQSDGAPLSTGLPLVDTISLITPGADVIVDILGNVFEIDRVSADGYMWVRKPADNGADIPTGNVSLYKKVAGIVAQDGTLIASIPTDWGNNTTLNFTKQNGKLSIDVNETAANCSYLTNLSHNTSGISNISFGQHDGYVEAKTEVRGVNYDIHSVLSLTDVYLGAAGTNAPSDSINFIYNNGNDGAPTLNTNKYMAIYTNSSSVGANELLDQVSMKIKMPQTWAISDGYLTKTFAIKPIIDFSATSAGELIYFNDAYGMSVSSNKDMFNFSAIDNYGRTSGSHSVLLDTAPELNIAMGLRHYIFDTETDTGQIELYRSGDGFLVLSITANNKLYNIRADISSWIAGQLHHIGFSWRLNTPDNMDELHLFIDGDEVPNEISTTNILPLPATFSQNYEETLNVIGISLNDGYIASNLVGYPAGGLFVPSTNAQPDNTWLGRTIVLKDLGIGELDCQPSAPGINLNIPLIVSSLHPINFDSNNGTLVIFSLSNGMPANFSAYSGSTDIQYGFATYAIAETLLTRTNFGVFINEIELASPSAAVPEYRQVFDSQIIELYTTLDGEYAEVSLDNNCDVITTTIKTFGMLSYRVSQSMFQYGLTHRLLPTSVENNSGNLPIETAYPILTNKAVFLTDFAAPIDVSSVNITKILLPKVYV